MEEDARRWIGALRSSHDVLVATITGLDDSALEQPSMASAWSVAQVLSHLGSGAELALASFDAARAGADPPGADSMGPVWDRWNAMTPRQAAASFVAADERHIAAYEALDAAALADLRVPLPFLPAPLDAAGIVAFRLGEHALHSWDVRAALDPTATVAPASTELLIDRLPVMVGLIGRFTPRETRPAEAATIGITTSGPGRRFELALGDTVELRPVDTIGDVDGSLTIPAEALLRLTSGRLQPGWPAADFELVGALSMADLRRAFPGY